MISKDDMVRLSEICAYIHNNLDKDLSVNKLSRQFGISISTLRRHFLQIHKVSASRYILNARMYAACVLLNRQKHSIVQVSAAVGYKSQSAFTHAFIKYFHCLPTELLKEKPAEGFLDFFDESVKWPI